MDGEHTRLVVVAGLDRASTEAVCDRLMRAEPGTVVVHHDLREIAEGVVHRRLRSGSAEASAAGEAVWRDYPDPFGSWHTDPCDDLDVEDTSTSDTRKDKA